VQAAGADRLAWVVALCPEGANKMGCCTASAVAAAAAAAAELLVGQKRSARDALIVARLDIFNKRSGRPSC
jgi:hypothetical protein